MRKFKRIAMWILLLTLMHVAEGGAQIDASRGIWVLPGDLRCARALELAKENDLLIYVQLESERDAREARQAAFEAGLLGVRIFVGEGSLDEIQMAGNLADGLIAHGPAAKVSEAEALRVLRPGGKAYLNDKELLKPIPEGVDDWSHPFHGPDNNPLSRDTVIRAPYLTQFLADPRYAPLPQVAVASRGRVFKAFGHVAFKEREEPWLNKLAAFNGYNGTLLWTRDLEPGIMVHRNTIIATPDTLFLGDHESCKLIDPATGRLKGEIKPPPDIAGGTFWKWMALEGGVLYALVGEDEMRDPVARHRMEGHGWPWNLVSEGFNLPENPWGFGRNLLAIDPKSKEILWHHSEELPVDSRALCMKHGRIYLFRHGCYLACLDARTGDEVWRKTAPEGVHDASQSPSSSLSIWLDSMDWTTGKIAVSGMDSKEPKNPFTWDWGDGTIDDGFFPQEHQYEDLTRNYVLKVIAHYPEGATDAKTMLIDFAGPEPYSEENAPALFDALGPYQNRQGWNTNWRTTCYLKCSEEALYFSGPQMSKLLAVSAEDGRVLWEASYDNYQLVLRDDGLYGISGPWDTKQSRIFDPLTGSVLANLDIGRRACSRPTGSTDALFFRARGGSVRLDSTTGSPQWISPMRAQCHDGVTVANGLLYWWPSVCDCNLTLYGVSCLGPAGEFDFQWRADESCLEKGDPRPIEPMDVSSADWPTFRGNNECTAVSKAKVHGDYHLLWCHTPRHAFTPTAPTCAGGLVFISGSDGVVHALDAEAGTLLWKAFVGGEVRISPTLWKGRAYVGSGDGWVYCLEALTGRRLWRFRAAPKERRIPVYGQLLSIWPAASGVLVEKGVAYFAAGIVNYDGTHVYALDAETGEVLWQNNSSGHLDPEARTGVCVQGHLLLHDEKLHLAGGTAVSPAMYDVRDGRCLNDPGPLKNCEARGSRGWELYKIGEDVVACGRPFYAHPKHKVFDADVVNKLLAAPVENRDILLVNNAKLLCYPSLGEEILSGCVANRSEQSWFSYDWGALKIEDIEPFWEKNCLGTRALAACRNAVVLARKEEVIALNLETGDILWVAELPAPPVPWGLALDREGRVIVTLEDGRVLAWAAEGK